MTPRVVGDASAVVAMLTDGGPVGAWAAGSLAGADLFAPHLMPFEVANILRRHEASGIVGADQAAQAHADLLDLPVELWPHEILAGRAWELRRNLTVYDGCYVALAEALEADLVTLDRRIGKAPGIRCRVSGPPASRSR